MSAIARAYSNALKRYPLFMQSFQAGTLMGVGDVVSQFVIERKSVKQYEWQRTARFFSIGMFMVGPTIKVWYGILDRRFGSGTKSAVLKKVALDQGLFAPCFVAAFMSVNYKLQGTTVSEIKTFLKRDYLDVVVAGWMVWPAVQICNFSLVPLHHQVLFVQTFALFWNTYMAWKTNRGPSESSEQS